MRRRPEAAYATNVRHYLHVLEAFARRWEAVGFIGPSEIDPATLRRLRPLLPARAFDIVARREAPPLPSGVARVGSTHVANLPSLKSAVTGRTVTASEIARIHGLQARQVSRAFRDVSFVQTVEGLAHIAIRSQAAPAIVVERRNLHHMVFEEPLETHVGFPFRPKLDPIRDLLEEEYHGAHRIVVYSEVAKTSFVERGIPSERLWVSPLPVSTSPSPIVPHPHRLRDPFQLLYVGRLDAYKGIDVAVAAVQALGRPYRLVVAGPGGEVEREWLRRQAGVEYLGVLSKSRLTQLYASSAALLAPSVESFGLAVLEATRAGTPVLLRDTTGVVDYLPTGSSRVIASRDPGVWADAIGEGFADLGDAWRDDVADILSFASAVRNQSALITDIVGAQRKVET